MFNFNADVFKEVINHIRQDAEAGKTLSQCLEGMPELAAANLGHTEYRGDIEGEEDVAYALVRALRSQASTGGYGYLALESLLKHPMFLSVAVLKDRSFYYVDFLCLDKCVSTSMCSLQSVIDGAWFNEKMAIDINE
jgi:hypothetical protein